MHPRSAARTVTAEALPRLTLPGPRSRVIYCPPCPERDSSGTANSLWATQTHGERQPRQRELTFLSRQRASRAEAAALPAHAPPSGLQVPAPRPTPALHLGPHLQASPPVRLTPALHSLRTPQVSTRTPTGLDEKTLTGSAGSPSAPPKFLRSALAPWGKKKNVPAAEGSCCQKRELGSKWCPRA